jgi:DNA invertase Pin-like site-specific DNA recombinase
MTKFVSYLRVSTQQQGKSGLGLDAQRSAVHGFAGEVLAEFVEVESGKGAAALAKRPQLKEALALCKKSGSTLVIAKLDRLARNVHFITGLMESGVDFVAVDMPKANKVMLQMHAVMSEWERDQISERTKAALAAAKQRGVRLGAAGAANLRPNLEQRQQEADNFASGLRSVLTGFRTQGLSQRRQVEELNRLGVRTSKGSTWSLIQLQRVCKRLESQTLAA